MNRTAIDRLILIATVAFTILLAIIGVSRRYQAEVELPGSVFFDDAYYYFVPAQNFVQTGVMSFDGEIVTNGFHPLWMGIVTAVVWLNDGQLDDKFSFAILLISVLFHLLGVLFVFLTGRALKASRISILLAMTVYFTLGLAYLFDGMETPVWLCTMTIFLWYLVRSPWPLLGRQSVVLGLIASLLVLARIDMALLVLVVLMTPALLDKKALGQSVRRYLLFALGGSLLVLYMAVSYVEAGLLFPVSGLAKGLKTSLLPSLASIADVIAYSWDRKSILLSMILSIVGIVSLTKLWRSGGSRDDKHALTLLIGMLFPFLFIAVHLFRSDWELWGWYYNPFYIAATLSVFAVDRYLVKERVNLRRPAGIVALVLITGLIGMRVYQETNNPYESLFVGEAKTINAFIQDHPGRYGMGDYAGHVGFISAEPVFQLEGLMLDREFLQMIRAEKPLLEILDVYDLDYYIAYRKEHPAISGADSLFAVAEPYWVQAGRHSRTSRDTFHVAPHQLAETIYIFDLSQEREIRSSLTDYQHLDP
jgi:hypothetical protein